MTLDIDPRRGSRSLRHGVSLASIGLLPILYIASLGCFGCGDDPAKPPDSPTRTPKPARYFTPNSMSFYLSNTGRPLGNEDPVFDGRVGYGVQLLITDLGLWIGATVNGEVHVSATSYFGGDFSAELLTPTIAALTYVLLPNDHPGIPDYDEWPMQLGAPATPEGHPRRIGNGTGWAIYHDRDASRHEVLHGAPLGAVVRQTVWAQDGFPSTLFVRFQLKNGSTQSWEETLLGVWADADVGLAGNDLVGCDVARSMVYTYTDPLKPESVFGPMQPALGIRMLRTPSDLGMIASPMQWKNQNEPVNVAGAINILRGVNIDGAAFVDSTTGEPTKFWASGDPVTHTGSVENISVDRRMMSVTGPVSVAPGASIELIFAILYAQDVDQLQAITMLRSLADQVARTSEVWDVE